jgi:glutamate-1-semialdehyde 2,1-aminomutase/spore coat polysaccharide biosynthesis protein SpsF
MKTVGIVQARMGSTRLPGKVMMDLGGMPVVGWSLRALKRAAGVNQVVLATSIATDDDVIAQWGEANHWTVVRGSEEDVLDRFMKVVEVTNADYLLRATGDCPFLDPQVISEVIALRERGNFAYCSNVNPPTYPDGLDIECFSVKALEIAHRKTTNSTDRDTVTQYIVRNRAQFPAGNVVCSIPGLDKERWVLDSAEDMEFCREVVKISGNSVIPYVRLLRLLDKYPHIRQHNLHLTRNERFFSHLTTESKQQYSYPRSKKALERALKVIPLGAQTFSKSHIQYPIEGPLFLSHGDGAYVFDVDGNRYLDLVCGLLPVILGYRDPDVDFAIRRQLDSGISFSLSTELEAELAEELARIIPCAEMSRFAKNGSDVTTAAIRLARACTGKDGIILVGSGYHGWHDWSIASTERNIGVPQVNKQLAFRVREDLDAIHDEIKRRKIAAVIVEPEGKKPAWLKTIRSLCDAKEVLLIFDEVITGFRWDLGGYQKYAKVTPDLACFGKAMANGMPISALCGKEAYMQRCAPPDNIFFSLTFGGEALSLAAALATINKIRTQKVIDHLWAVGHAINELLRIKIDDHGLDEVITIHGDAPRLHVNMPDRLRPTWMKAMIDAGVLIINCNNMSWPIRDNEITHLMAAYDIAFEAVKCALASNNVHEISPDHRGHGIIWQGVR